MASADWEKTEYAGLIREAVNVERARCAKIAEAWRTPSYARLHAGEMGAQEMRTVQAVALAIATEIRAV